jgi:MFS family permease
MKALFIAVFSAMLGLGIVAPLMPIYAKSLGASGVLLGAIFSGFSVSRALFMPVIGRLSDRFGKKIFLLFGLFLYSVISLLYMTATNAYHLVVIRFFHGISSAMVIPCAMAYVSELAKEGEEGRVISSFNVSFLLGVGFGPFLGGFIKDLFGLKSAFVFMSALTALAFLLVALFVPNFKIKTANKKFRTVILSRMIKALMIFRFSNAFRLALVLAFLPIMISHFRGYQIGLVVSTIVLANALFQKVFGHLADVFDRVKLALAGSLLSTACFLSLPFLNDFVQFVLMALFMGFGNAMAMSSASAIAVTLGREYGHGSVMGLFNMAMSLAMIVSPILAGVITDLIDLRSAFIFAGFVSVVGLFIFYILSLGDERGICKDKPQIRREV